MNLKLQNCPFCAEEIKNEAIKCKHCGEILDAEIRKSREKEKQLNAPKQRVWSPGIAAVLSLIIPGAGQMYKGEILTGLLWLIIVPIGYLMLIFPGLILHFVCIILASSGNPYRQY